MLAKAPGYFTQMLSQKKVDHFQQKFSEISNAMSSVGWEVEPGEIFDSGYQGFHFKVNGHKFLIIEQPGAVGLEDHRTGYLSIHIDGKQTIVTKHKDRHFGDVRLNEHELQSGYTTIVEMIEEYLEQHYQEG